MEHDQSIVNPGALSSVLDDVYDYLSFLKDMGWAGFECTKDIKDILESWGKPLVDHPDSMGRILAEVQACCGCKLRENRGKIVFGSGDEQARLVFVGEGPGENEDLQGRPFVGRAGQLLDKIIIAMGLKRSDVYICNIIKCRPPENREPRPEEIISCLPYLKKQLELIRPKVIVALGAPATKTLLATNKPIGQMRGKFFDYYFDDFSPPIKLMPTFHPAYLLRNYSHENRLRVWEDMKSVLTELGLPVPK